MNPRYKVSYHMQRASAPAGPRAVIGVIGNAEAENVYAVLGRQPGLRLPSDDLRSTESPEDGLRRVMDDQAGIHALSWTFVAAARVGDRMVYAYSVTKWNGGDPAKVHAEPSSRLVERTKCPLRSFYPRVLERAGFLKRVAS